VPGRIRDLVGSLGSTAVAAGATGALLLAAGLSVSCDAGQAGIVNLDEVAKAHFLFLADPGHPELRGAIGPDPKAVEAREKRLKSLRERLARERATLNREEKEALQKAIQEETAALQRLLGKTTRDVFEGVRMRSPENFFPHLTTRIQEYGRERQLTRLTNKRDGRLLYQDPDGAEPAEGEPIDLTKSLIEWLRMKDRALFDDTATPPAPQDRRP